MAQGFFALAGVLLGGFITVGVHLVLEAFAMRRRRQLAIRVLFDDLRLASAVVEACIEDRSTRPLEVMPAMRDDWREHRESLGGLSFDTWRKIESAVVQVSLLASTELPDWDDETPELLQELDDGFKQAMDAISGTGPGRRMLR